MRASRAALVAAATTLALAGCGGPGLELAASRGNPFATAPLLPSGSPAAQAHAARTPQAAAGAPAAAEPAAEPVSDRTLARRLVLRAADFPRGWQSDYYEPSDRDRRDAKALAACAGAPDPEVVTVAEAFGPVAYKDMAHVMSATSIVRTLDDVRADTAAASRPRFMTCLKRYVGTSLRRAFDAGLSPGRLESVTIRRVPVAQYGDFTRAYRTISTIKYDGITARIYADVVLLAKGRAETAALFVRVNEGFYPALQKRLVAILGARLARA